jgi:hypothetical protein
MGPPYTTPRYEAGLLFILTDMLTITQALVDQIVTHAR